MIGYLHGRCAFMQKDCVIIDTTGGVGYRVFFPASSRKAIKQGEDTALFIYTAVREDAILLYGFATQEEYHAFLALVSVSRIGAKAALGILSALSVGELCTAVQENRADLLARAPGIGKKTAERLLLELHDKPFFAENLADTIGESEDIDMGNHTVEDATQALLALGYTQAEITSVLKKHAKITTTEDLIKAALKALVNTSGIYNSNETR